MTDLTKEQAKAVNYLFDKPRCPALQIVAAAGSGKTHTMVEAIRLASKNVDLTKVCVITFTKKAASEMGHRLGTICQNLYFSGTMHALAYSLLGAGIDILQNKGQILKKICQQRFKHYQYIPADLIALGNFLDAREKETLQLAYKQYKIDNGVKDFDDLLIEARDSLKKGLIKPPSIEILFIDEFQDTSPLQLSFLQQLRAKRVFAVGDDWQSIYKFRGADVTISQNFSKYFPGATRLFLRKNFRSQKRIVKLGNQVIALSKKYVKKKVSSHLKKGKRARLVILQNVAGYQRALEHFLLWYNKNIGKENPTFLVRTNFIKEQISQPGVKCMTIHAAKGLEFDNVCVFGVNFNQIPHAQGDFDEETRLLYVAITRARHRLFLVGWAQENTYSPFLEPLAKWCQVTYLDAR